jgi:hypothetical protein
VSDTPLNIKELQQKIWLSKPPMERLRQMLEDNAALFQFWSTTKKNMQKTYTEGEGIRK